MGQKDDTREHFCVTESERKREKETERGREEGKKGGSKAEKSVIGLTESEKPHISIF